MAFSLFFLESLRKQDLQNQTQTSQSFLNMYGHLDKGAGAHSNCTVAFRKPSEKIRFSLLLSFLHQVLNEAFKV